MSALLEMRTRKVASTDGGFVMSSWLRSMKRGPTTKRMPLESYYSYARPLLMRLLSSRDVELRIAYAPANEADLLGWLCWSKAGRVAVVHYAYTAQRHRGQGVMRRLAAEAGVNELSEIAYTTKSPQTSYVVKRVAHAEFIPLEGFLS